jgi:hypothetical protein
MSSVEQFLSLPFTTHTTGSVDIDRRMLVAQGARLSAGGANQELASPFAINNRFFGVRFVGWFCRSFFFLLSPDVFLYKSFFVLYTYVAPSSVDEDHIVTLDNGCAQTAEELVRRNA